jgi:hypothetical protein
MTIVGNSFQNGATVKLVQAGYPPVAATGVSVSSTSITCTFSLGSLQKGYANVRVTNRDGQSGDIENVFYIGEATSVVSSVGPVTGTLSITSSPSGANVWVDGSFKGTTPITLSDQAAGSHTVRFEKVGYSIDSTTTTVYAGQTATANGYLNPNTPVPTTPTPLPSQGFGSPDLSGLIILLIIGIVVVAGGYIGYSKIVRSKEGKPPAPPKLTRQRAKITDPKPELTLSLDRTQLSAERWHKLGITLTNTGLADVENISFAFSSEFETKGIKPISVKAGQSSRTDISIISKNVGNILLEITLTYKDIKGREYKKVQEFWIDVVEKGTTTSPPSETPSSPVSQFTPRPLTPKQLPPELFDRYTESEFIGKGGFARVFKAKRKDGKYVAVKIPISLDASTGRSFIAEMQNWTKLSHPNIVRLYDFNIMPMPYFEEELCDSALADQNKPIESEEAAWIMFNICEGLKFAHAQKIIHRDLKPQNILLKNGVPKISDWGLSRIISESTTTTATSFTPYYAAPEQINNRLKDERTDIWQLGVILYELVTGELPFKGDSMTEIGMSIATKDPILPGEIKPDAKVIDAVVMKCLEKDPAKRYQSVLELQKDLAMYLRKNYAELLNTSVSIQDYTRSASYCGDLVMINMHTGDIPTAYKYLLDFVKYSKSDVKAEAQELSEQIKMRMEMGVTEIPDELIQKAEIIVHHVSVGFRKRG